MPFVPAQSKGDVWHVLLHAGEPVGHDLGSFHVPRKPKRRFAHGLRKIRARRKRSLCGPFLLERPFSVPFRSLPPIAIERTYCDRIARPFSGLSDNARIFDRGFEPGVHIPDEHPFYSGIWILCREVKSGAVFHERRHRRKIARIREFAPLALPVSAFAVVSFEKPCAKVLVRHENIRLVGIDHHVQPRIGQGMQCPSCATVRGRNPPCAVGISRWKRDRSRHVQHARFSRQVYSFPDESRLVSRALNAPCRRRHMVVQPDSVHAACGICRRKNDCPEV